MPTYEIAFIEMYEKRIPFKTLEEILTAFNYFVNNNTEPCNKIMRE